MLNVVALMGRFTKDPELRQTQSGISVCSFSLAVDRSYVKPGEERQCDFIDCVAWRSTAEFISKWFKKGSLIAVDGRLQTRNYTDKSGARRKAVEVLVNNANFAESKKNSENKNERSSPAKKAPSASKNPAPSVSDKDEFTDLGDISDDDLPF